MKKEISVRNLEKRDLTAIINLEERQTGVARPEYWEKRIEISEAIRPHWASLVAEIDNRVVGPAFKEVAKRYRGQTGAEAKLVEKLRRGGGGAWG